MHFHDPAFLRQCEPATLEWRDRYAGICFDPEEPSVRFSMQPLFPMASSAIFGDTFVWDLQALMNSVRQPGAYSIVNCECGQPFCVGIDTSVLVSHPDENTVVWEMDREGFRAALEKTIPEGGFVRLVFDRNAYESEIRTMLKRVQAAGRIPVPVEKLRDLENYESFVRKFPEVRELPVEAFMPDHSGCDLEDFLELDPDALWDREPRFPSGTRIEIGLFGSELWKVDGQISWIGNIFTRWTVQAAFDRWMNTVTRRYALEDRKRPFMEPSVVFVADGDAPPDAPPPLHDPNEFVILPGIKEEDSHLAGEAFAAILARSFAEGRTAPGVEVVYVRQSQVQEGS